MDISTIDITTTTATMKTTNPITCVGHTCLTQGHVVGFLSCNIIIALVGIVGNALVILSVARTRPLQNQNNLFLASLAVADLMVSAIGIPAHAAVGFGFKPRVDPWLCLSVGTFVTGMAYVNIFQIAVVSFDRYLAVTSPLTYNQKMTRRRVAALISIIWLTSAAIASVAFAWNNIDDLDDDDEGSSDVFFLPGKWYRIMAVTLVVLFPFSAMTYWNCVISRIALSHRRRIQAMRFVLGSNGVARAENVNVISKLKSDMRAAFTLFIILGVFVLAWTPGTALVLIDKFEPLPKLRSTYIYVLIATTSAFLNSAVNPIIYAARNKEFRKAFGDQLQWIVRCFTKG